MADTSFFKGSTAPQQYTEASTSAAEALAAQVAAEAALASTAALYDSFDDRYLGAKSSDPSEPSLDNDGNPLVDGALYWSTTWGIMRVWWASPGEWRNATAGVVEWNGRNGSVTPVAGDYNAAQITNTPAGSISATTVQDALNELDGDVSSKADAAATTTALASKADAAATTTALAAKADAAATTTALAAKAPLASPGLTGTPTAPTAADGTNTTQIATTGFVQSALNLLKNGVSAAFDTLSEIATAIGLKADIASPTFTGTPAAPTAAVDTTTTQLATTAFVIGQAASVAPVAPGTAAVGTSKSYARQDHVHPKDATKADASKFPTSTATAVAKYADTTGSLANTGVLIDANNVVTAPGFCTVVVTVAADGLTSIAVPGGQQGTLAIHSGTPGTTPSLRFRLLPRGCCVSGTGQLQRRDERAVHVNQPFYVGRHYGGQARLR
jgi:hypothetical protein